MWSVLKYLGLPEELSYRFTETHSVWDIWNPRVQVIKSVVCIHALLLKKVKIWEVNLNYKNSELLSYLNNLLICKNSPYKDTPMTLSCNKFIYVPKLWFPVTSNLPRKWKILFCYIQAVLQCTRNFNAQVKFALHSSSWFTGIHFI